MAERRDSPRTSAAGFNGVAPCAGAMPNAAGAGRLQSGAIVFNPQTQHQTLSQPASSASRPVLPVQPTVKRVMITHQPPQQQQQQGQSHMHPVTLPGQHAQHGHGVQYVLVHPSTAGGVAQKPLQNVQANMAQHQMVQQQQSRGPSPAGPPPPDPGPTNTSVAQGQQQHAGVGVGQQARQTAGPTSNGSEAVNKCAKFFKTLITLSEQNKVGSMVIDLVKSVIWGSLSAEQFTQSLQRALNSTAQPHLLPFLQKTLPALREALESGQVKIEGVERPATVSQAQPQVQLPQGDNSFWSVTQPPRPQLQQPKEVRVQLPQYTMPQYQTSSNATIATVSGQGSQQPTTMVLLAPGQQQQHVYTAVQTTSMAGWGAQSHQQPVRPQQQLPSTSQQHPQPYHMQQVKSEAPPSVPPISPAPSPASSRSVAPQPTQMGAPSSSGAKWSPDSHLPAAAPAAKRLRRAPMQAKSPASADQAACSSAADLADDELNDVTAMGGVNLNEETQRIMAGCDNLLQGEMRTCDEPPDQRFLDYDALSIRLRVKWKAANPRTAPSALGIHKDVITMVSLAARQRAAKLVHAAARLAAHKQTNLRTNPYYEPAGGSQTSADSVRLGVRFLESLDRLEAARREQREKELLLRLSRSKNRITDPHAQALKDRAKEMQKAEAEAARNREANAAAMLALGGGAGPTAGAVPGTSGVTLENPFERPIGVAPKGPGLRTQTARRRLIRVGLSELRAALLAERPANMRSSRLALYQMAVLAGANGAPGGVQKGDPAEGEGDEPK